MRADDRRLGAVAIVLFFATRVLLLVFRQPFFDELYTQWISSKSFVDIFMALHHDSGPPLYYFLVHVFGHPRVLSLVFSTIAFTAVLGEKQFVAAILLALFPPSVLFAVDGRGYALCAMFVTIGVLALDRDRPFLAAGSFVLAAYSHYYGALFFPLVRRWKPALLYLLFLPAIALALHQPKEAIAWMRHFAYPDALFVRPPLVLVIAMLALWTAGFSRQDRRLQSARKMSRPKPADRPAEVGGPAFATAYLWLIPWILSLPIYVPFRFESVVATPLMQWVSSARRIVVIGLALCFAAWTVVGIAEHRQRPPDDYREAALQVRDAKETVVASGYLYLHTALLRPAIAFPPEQAVHPGWRATATSGNGLPPGTFLWIGERGAPELAIISRTRTMQPVYVNARAVVMRVR